MQKGRLHRMMQMMLLLTWAVGEEVGIHPPRVRHGFSARGAIVMALERRAEVGARGSLTPCHQRK